MFCYSPIRVSYSYEAQHAIHEMVFEKAENSRTLTESFVDRVAAMAKNVCNA